MGELELTRLRRLVAEADDGTPDLDLEAAVDELEARYADAEEQPRCRSTSRWTNLSGYRNVRCIALQTRSTCSSERSAWIGSARIRWERSSETGSAVPSWLAA